MSLSDNTRVKKKPKPVVGRILANQKPCDMIEAAILLAVSHGYDMSDKFMTVESEGRYAAPDHICHPLESVIVGNYINCPINFDISYQLGVPPSWVDGFINGYAGKSPNKKYEVLKVGDILRKQYCNGYAAGAKTREFVVENEQFPITN